jgi:hypothetical protein
MTVIRWLIKWFPLVTLFVFLMTLFQMNDQMIQIKYYGLHQPITAHFWELVIFCVALGIIVVAIGDLITQLKWHGERRRMVKRDRGHLGEVQALNEKIQKLEAENQTLQREKEQKSQELARIRGKSAVQPTSPPIELSKA